MRAALTLITLLAVPSLAFADAVEPPPDDCPAGSTPRTSHSGPLCSATACDPASCDATCEPVMQCVETRDCGGRLAPDSAPCTVDHVVGPCEGDGSCAVGVCRPRTVCGGASDGGCGCRAAGVGAGGELAGAMFVLALFAARMRRASRRTTAR